MTLRAALYARVSTDEQAESSIDEQLAACREAAAAHGWRVDFQESDYGISGATSDRPGFQRLLDSMDDWDVFVTWNDGELSVTPTAVSHQIRALEEHLEIPSMRR